MSQFYSYLFSFCINISSKVDNYLVRMQCCIGAYWSKRLWGMIAAPGNRVGKKDMGYRSHFIYSKTCTIQLFNYSTFKQTLLTCVYTSVHTWHPCLHVRFYSTLPLFSIIINVRIQLSDPTLKTLRCVLRRVKLFINFQFNLAPRDDTCLCGKTLSQRVQNVEIRILYLEKSSERAFQVLIAPLIRQK